MLVLVEQIATIECHVRSSDQGVDRNVVCDTSHSESDLSRKPRPCANAAAFSRAPRGPYHRFRRTIRLHRVRSRPAFGEDARTIHNGKRSVAIVSVSNPPSTAPLGAVVVRRHPFSASPGQPKLCPAVGLAAEGVPLARTRRKKSTPPVVLIVEDEPDLRVL